MTNKIRRNTQLHWSIIPLALHDASSSVKEKEQRDYKVTFYKDEFQLQA